MTKLTKDMIPTTIDSVEAIVVWGMEVLQNLYPNATCIEFTDINDLPVDRRVVESNKFYITADDPATWRHLSRLSVKLRPEHQATGRIWEHVVSLGDLAIPLGMRAQ